MMSTVKEATHRMKQIFICRFWFGLLLGRWFDIRFGMREKAFIDPIVRIGMHRKALRVRVVAMIDICCQIVYLHFDRSSKTCSYNRELSIANNWK